MHPWRCAVAGIAFLSLAPLLQAGLYYSGESFAELPSQWRGFLLDQRALRMIAAQPIGVAPSPLRKDYLEADYKRLCPNGDCPPGLGGDSPRFGRASKDCIGTKADEPLCNLFLINAT